MDKAKVDSTVKLATATREAVLNAVSDIVGKHEHPVDGQDKNGFDQDDHRAVLIGIGAALGDIASAKATIAQPKGTMAEVIDDINEAFAASVGWAAERVNKYDEKAGV